MSFFLLQPIAASSSPISGVGGFEVSDAAQGVSSGLFGGLFNAALAGASALNNVAERTVAAENALLELGNLKNLSAEEQAIAASYFVQIIQQLKLDNPAINVGAAPDGIKDIQAENEFMAGAVELIQQAKLGQKLSPQDEQLLSVQTLSFQTSSEQLVIEQRIIEQQNAAIIPLQIDAPIVGYPLNAESQIASNAASLPEQSVISAPNDDAASWQFLQPTDFMNSAVAAVAYKQAPAIMASEKIIEQAVAQNIAPINIESVSAEPLADSQIINANAEANISLSNSNVAGENGGAAQNNSSQNNDGNGGAFSRSAAEMIEGKTDVGIDTGGAGFSAGNDVTVTAPEKEISLLRFEENKPATSLNNSPFEQISVQIKKLQLDKTGEINLQLNPYELGKVEIKIVTDENNKMIVQITADNRETYDLLRADRASLERILQNDILRGEDISKSDLQFAHRETNREANSEGRNQNSADNDNNKSTSASNVVSENEVDVSLINEQIINLNVTTGINIKI